MPNADAELVQIEWPRPGVALLRLTRPERLNALSPDLVAAIPEALTTVADDPGCRVIILTGAGRGFCAGLDLRGYGQAPNADGFGRPQAGFAVQRHIARL